LGGLLKFQQFSALQKHIHASVSLKQVPRSYLIIHPQREERRKLLEELGKELTTLYKNAATSFLEGEEASWGQVIDMLMSPSLFGDEQIIIWNGLKNLPEPVLEKSRSYILNPSPGAFFLMGAESAKVFSDLYQNTKKELILLDFSEEKP
jgi:DNA polymerase III delta subunit